MNTEFKHNIFLIIIAKDRNNKIIECPSQNRKTPSHITSHTETNPITFFSNAIYAHLIFHSCAIFYKTESY